MTGRSTSRMAVAVAALGLILPRAAATDEVKAGLATAAQAPTVEEILAKADANLTRVKDQTYQAQLEVVRDGKVTKTLRFEVKLKGLQQKLVRFTAPGDVRGMAVLTTADGLMYVYMPSYQRVRRIAAHVRNQGFMGTDVTPEEMSTAALSVGWKARILKQDDKAWVLELKPGPGNETAYSKLVVTVSKRHEGTERIESYDAAGKHVRTQIRSEWKDFAGGIHMPTVFTFEDLRTGSQTVLRFQGCAVNQGVPDSAFTTRALTRGD